MTTAVKCTIYYSVTGERFDCAHLEHPDLERDIVLLHIYQDPEADEPKITELSLPNPIHKGKFFNSHSYCAFMNEKGHLLHFDHEYLFKICLHRNERDKDLLHVKFPSNRYQGHPIWSPYVP